MVFSVRKGKRPQQELISAMEAHNIWDVLTSIYSSIERLESRENFAHDTGLKTRLNDLRARELGFASRFQTLCERYSVKTADGPRRGMNTSANTEAIYDEQIAVWTLTAVQERFELFFSAIHTSVTNDALRAELTAEVKWQAEYLDGFIKYLKLKGWLNQPPLYRNVPRESPEQLDTGEAYHLWDHLTSVYDGMALMNTYSEVAKDGDLKAMLGTINDVISGWAPTLEKEILKFGLPMPKPPAKVRAKPENAEWLDDDYILRHILAVMQGSTLLHTSAFKQSTTNDRVRTIFRRMLLEATELRDKLVKYSKRKGWLNEPPMYRL